MIDAFIGCDPGSTGSFCLLSFPDNTQPEVEFFDNDNPTDEIHEWLQQCHFKYNVKMSILERVHSVPLVSAKSNFIFGGNFYRVKTLLELQNYGLDFVTPKTWQKGVGVSVPTEFKGADRKKRIKLVVAEICNNIYKGAAIYGPQGGLKDGRADSLLLAHYARLKYGVL